MRYFLHIDSMIVFNVPKKYYKHLDIINSKSDEHDDYEVNESIHFLSRNCKPKLKIAALSQTL